VALEFRPSEEPHYAHVCHLPWPADPEIPEGHLCECGRRWMYQPAHWDPLWTLEELRQRQEAGVFGRGVLPRARCDAHEPEAELAAPSMAPDQPDPPEPPVIVPMPATRGRAAESKPRAAPRGGR
jgi:hypothetical protein